MKKELKLLLASYDEVEAALSGLDSQIPVDAWMSAWRYPEGKPHQRIEVEGFIKTTTTIQDILDSVKHYKYDLRKVSFEYVTIYKHAIDLTIHYV